jgi:hypothetical protein
VRPDALNIQKMWLHQMRGLRKTWKTNALDPAGSETQTIIMGSYNITHVCFQHISQQETDPAMME